MELLRFLLDVAACVSCKNVFDLTDNKNAGDKKIKSLIREREKVLRYFHLKDYGVSKCEEKNKTNFELK